MWFIRNGDGLWLAGLRQGLNSSGRPTCIWCDKPADARGFEEKAQARTVAANMEPCEIVRVPPWKRGVGA